MDTYGAHQPSDDPTDELANAFMHVVRAGVTTQLNKSQQSQPGSHGQRA